MRGPRTQDEEPEEEDDVSVDNQDLEEESNYKQ